MLIRVKDKEKIKDKWDVIWSLVESNIPPIVGKARMRSDRILQAVLNEQVYLWAVHADGNLDDAFGFILTSITYDVFSDGYSMFIVSIASMSEGGSKEWVEAATELFRHAIRKGCGRVFGYSKNPLVINLLRELNANTEYTFVYAEIKE